MTIDEIRTIVSVQLGIPEIDAEDDIIRDLGAESADIVGIIAAVEDKYGITVDEGELVDIHTVGELFSLARGKLQPDQ